jgi:hypothetical protein
MTTKPDLIAAAGERLASTDGRNHDTWVRIRCTECGQPFECIAEMAAHRERVCLRCFAGVRGHTRGTVLLRLPEGEETGMTTKLDLIAALQQLSGNPEITDSGGNALIGIRTEGELPDGRAILEFT